MRDNNRTTENKTMPETTVASTVLAETKVKSIENSVPKNRIRSELAGQICDAVKLGNSKDPNRLTMLCGASLPASHWHFEGLVKSRLEMETYANVKFDGAEMNPEICLESIRNMPENASIACCSFNDLLTKPIYRNKSGVGLLCEEGAKVSAEMRRYDFIWADYCCPANLELIQDTANHIANCISETGGFYYATFSLNTRTQGSRREVAKQLNKISKSKMPKNKSDMEILHDAVENAIMFFLKQNRVSTKVDKVYDVIYGGGETGQTKMMTIGFACFLPKGITKPIIENRSDAISELKRKRYQTALRFKTKGFDIIRVKEVVVKTGKPTGRRGRPATSLSHKVRSRLDQGWDTERIAKYYKVTNGQVGSIKAWHNNPESFRK